jgi:hypothetical protein
LLHSVASTAKIVHANTANDHVFLTVCCVQ